MTPREYQDYWISFIDLTNALKPTFAIEPKNYRKRLPSPSQDYFMNWKCFGRSGFMLVVCAREDTKHKFISVNFDIQKNEQKHHFATLVADRIAIDAAIGKGGLRWESKPLPDERSQTMAIWIDYSPTVFNRSDWTRQHSLLIETTEAFYRAFKPRVDAL